MEILGAGEVLADQLGADDLAVLVDQAAIRLMGEDGLCDTGHSERIGNSGDERHQGDHGDGRPDLFQHGVFLTQDRRP